MNESRPSFLLVDGNNVVHAWPDLLRLHARSPASARAELIRRIDEYQGFSEERAVLVFDGRGSTTNEERTEAGLQIFYAGEGRTADDIIEHLALKYAATCDMTVATNDRAEQDMVSAAGAHVISADGLRERLESVDRQMKDWLERHRKR
ncbi:MAG: NYN domain-containing protein [Verrucomicrobiales bacterium]